MAKLTKEEFTNRINSLDIDDDLKISLLEDVADSFDAPIELTAEEKVKIDGYDDIKYKYETLKEKYKERFLTNDSVDTDDTNETVEELEEKEVIDVKEI